MRIRKHAKISSLVYATSSLKPGTHLQTHFCQLNQSPWDVMKFSPPSSPPPPSPPPQVDRDGVCAVNGSLSGCISVTERDRWEYPDDIPANPTTVKAESAAASAAVEEIIYCCKMDGKSWQCKKLAAEGYALSQARSYSNGYHYVTKKPEKLRAEARRPARNKKASTSSNPYEFYYYSGFGPRWGKKRGEACNNTSNSNNNNVSLSKNVECDDEMVDEESDVDEDDEEIDGRDNNIGKKRVRKPIKARSLKSLM